MTSADRDAEASTVFGEHPRRRDPDGRPPVHPPARPDGHRRSGGAPHPDRPRLDDPPRPPARRRGVPLDRPTLPSVVRRSPATDAALRRAVRSGELVRLRAGVYAPAPTGPDAAQRRRAATLLGVRAALEKLPGERWFSHETAAMLWGCWTWRPSGEVHVTHLWHPNVARAVEPGTRRHTTALPVRDRAELVDAVSGLIVPVTTLERTLVDCARTQRPESALVVVDAGLRLGADRALLAELLVEATGARGVRQARRVLALADGASESPGESVVRWAVHEAGLVAPKVAVEVETWAGRRWVDLGWPEQRVGIEFDGAVKYSGAYGDPRQVLLDEKRRHDALVEAGWVLVRVTADDLREPIRVAARVRAALESRRAIPSRTRVSANLASQRPTGTDSRGSR